MTGFGSGWDPFNGDGRSHCLGVPEPRWGRWLYYMLDIQADDDTPEAADGPDLGTRLQSALVEDRIHRLCRTPGKAGAGTGDARRQRGLP